MKSLDKGNDVGLIAGIIGAIILIAIIVIAVVLYRRYKSPLFTKPVINIALRPMENPLSLTRGIF